MSEGMAEAVSGERLVVSGGGGDRGHRQGPVAMAVGSARALERWPSGNGRGEIVRRRCDGDGPVVVDIRQRGEGDGVVVCGDIEACARIDGDRAVGLTAVSILGGCCPRADGRDVVRRRGRAVGPGGALAVDEQGCAAHRIQKGALEGRQARVAQPCALLDQGQGSVSFKLVSLRQEHCVVARRNAQ